MMRDDFFLKASDTLILCVWFKFINIDVISLKYVVHFAYVHYYYLPSFRIACRFKKRAP
jgi:hypothetical protein